MAKPTAVAATAADAVPAPATVHLVRELLGGCIYGIADSPETGKALAAEHVQDYYGNPIVWTYHDGSALAGPYWEGTYVEHAHRTSSVLVEEHTLRAATSLAASLTD